MVARYVADDLIVGEGAEARLLGGRRRSDGKLVFPLPKGPEAELYDAFPLATHGTLWSYTVQRFRPKHPFNGPGDDGDFRPYAVGYVELPGQIIVESRIETEALEGLVIGMPMTLSLQAFRQDSDGADVVTFAFRPA